MLQRTMMFMKVDEDTPIESRMITKVIESAQKRIEGLHFSSRKNVLQYDDVNNQQRKAIYKERDRILDNEDIHADILAMVPDYARYALAEACDSDENTDNWKLDKVNKALSMYFDFEQPILTEENVSSARQVCDMLAERCRDYLEERANEQTDDGQVPFREAERYFLLKSLDDLWIDHIDALDELRTGVGLQAIGQHDPLAVYKKEAYDMFERLNEQIKVQTIRLLTFARITYSLSSEQTSDEVINPERKLNGPCPCGSGKKYKNCCYLKDKAKQGGAQDAIQGDRSLTKQEEYALKRQLRKEAKNNKK